MTISVLLIAAIFVISLVLTMVGLGDPRPDVSDAMIKREAAFVVRSALDALPANQRLAIVLRYYEDLNYEEIASALETTTKAVERLLARGRECLRTTLGNRDLARSINAS